MKTLDPKLPLVSDSLHEVQDEPPGMRNCLGSRGTVCRVIYIAGSEVFCHHTGKIAPLSGISSSPGGV